MGVVRECQQRLEVHPDFRNWLYNMIILLKDPYLFRITSGIDNDNYIANDSLYHLKHTLQLINIKGGEYLLSHIMYVVGNGKTKLC